MWQIVLAIEFQLVSPRPSEYLRACHTLSPVDGLCGRLFLNSSFSLFRHALRSTSERATLEQRQRLEVRESRRQLEQQRQVLPVGEPDDTFRTELLTEDDSICQHIGRVMSS